MSREQLEAMAAANRAHVAAGTLPLADDVMRVPAANYSDPERWEREVGQIFHRLPLLLAFSAEMRSNGDYKALDVAGTPVLLSRSSDGVVRGFINLCSHRGAQIMEPGTGSARRFTCPYHAWNYDQSGALVGIFERDIFGEVDDSCMGLTELPVAERAGLIWGGIRPDLPVDIDTFLCGYDDLLAHHGLADAHFVTSRTLEGPNWKVAYDGYLDLYHLPILHKDTFGPDFPNKAIFSAWGPHQRVSGPNPKYLSYQGTPQDWPTDTLMTGVWTIFPHVSIAAFNPGLKTWQIAQLFPGPTVDTSVTILNFLTETEPTDDQLAGVQQQIDFLEHVVRDEDYATGRRISNGLKIGDRGDFVFGRNEGGGQTFHRWVDKILAATDDELPGLFSSE
jgi:phenylpropionate dioxygenase-like ring-hydroxylating dioxygenase large terminal subunit